MIKKKIQTVQCFGDLSFHPDILPAWTLPASNIKLGIFALMVNHFNQYVISQHVWLHLWSENGLDQHALQLTKVTKKKCGQKVADKPFLQTDQESLMLMNIAVEILIKAWRSSFVSSVSCSVCPLTHWVMASVGGICHWAVSECWL